MGVRAKFKATTRAERVVHGAEGEKKPWWEIEFAAVRPTKMGEDSIFGKYSPSGRANLTGLVPEAAAAFSPDRAFYVDFHAEHEVQPKPEGAYRVRMVCNGVRHYDAGGDEAHEVTLYLTGAGADPADSFQEKHAGGSLTIGIHNPPAGRQFKPAQVFVVDFIPTDDPSY